MALDNALCVRVATELNAILLNDIVCGLHCHLRTFGGIKWEYELFSGRPKARCNPFNIDGHRFRQKSTDIILCIENNIVYYIVYDIVYDIIYDMTSWHMI